MNHASIFYVSYLFFIATYGTMIPRVRVIWTHGTLHWMGLLSNDVLAHSNVSPDEFSYAVWLNTAKDPQRTAKDHYGLSCRKLAPIELNGALYSSARQDFSNAAGLGWEPALSDSQSVRRGRRQTATSVDVEISFFVSVIRSIGCQSLTRRRCQSRSSSASGTLCSRWHATIGKGWRRSCLGYSISMFQ